MEDIKQYLLSVTAAAIICSLITGMIGKKGTYPSVVRLLCGIFLTITTISPLAKIKIADISSYINEFKAEATQNVEDGKVMADQESAAIIKSKLEAYIWDKASSLGLDITADVVLEDSDLKLPVSVTLEGAASPYVKQKLEQIITSNLGIPEENLIWK